LISTAIDYFQLPNDLNALVFVLQAKNYNLSSEFFIACYANRYSGCALMSFGNRQAGMEVVVTSDGRVEQRIWANFNMNDPNPAGIVTTGWSFCYFQS
jgi:hypothetical protein